MPFPDDWISVPDASPAGSAPEPAKDDWMPTFDIDWSRPIPEVRAEIGKLPESARPEALRQWADAYVARERAQRGPLSVGEDPIRSITRGTFAGPWLDEANAATAAGLYRLTGGALGAPYDEAVAYQRAQDRAVDRESYLNAPLQVVGALAGGGAAYRAARAAGLPAIASMTLPRQMAAGAGLGATHAASYGAGVSEGDVGERVAAGASAAPIGAAFGAVVPVALRGAGALGQRIGARAAQRATDVAADVAAHGRAGVRPFGPGFSSGPMASIARQLEEVPVIGAPVRRAREESVSDAARAVQGLAGRFGAATTADEAGLVAREGLERFRDARPADVVEREAAGYTPAQLNAIISAPVRATSLRTKQAALYQRAWSRIPVEMQQGRAVRGQPRVVGAMPNTREVIQGIAARNTRMINAQGGAAEAGTGRTLPGGFIGRVIDAIRNPDWRAALQTMRDIRSDFRRMQSVTAQTEGNVLRHSDIDRIESAITRDMIGLLERNAGEYARMGRPDVAANMRRAITDFRRADNFTRLAMQRMERIERLFNADNATALYRNIAQASLGGTRGDVSKLRVLARTLRREEIDEIAAYVLRAMGDPVGSARGFVQEIGFSPSSFMTRFNNMLPEARAIIFGREHTQALNDLERVVRRLADVEALVNTSRSGTNILNLGGLMAGGGALAAGSWEAALGTIGTGALASVMFSRPSYVRWVEGYARLRAAAQNNPERFASALSAHVGRLSAMAEDDPELEPAVEAVRREQQGAQ